MRRCTRKWVVWTGFSVLLAMLAPLTVADASEAAPEAAVSSRLIFLFSPANKPPFWYFEADQPRGLLFDLLTEVAALRGLEVTAEPVSRKRGDFQVQDHPERIVVRALEWMPDPEAYAYSDPVIATPDVFVSERRQSLKRDEVLSGPPGMLVGTHIGYRYPDLEAAFASGQLLRSDAASELAMLERVARRRTPVAFMAYPVARWYIRMNGWQQQFYLSEPLDSGYRLRLFFHPHQHAFVTFFNREFERMRRDGRWQKLLDRYL